MSPEIKLVPSVPTHQLHRVERVLLGLDDLARLGVRISRQTAWRWMHSRKMPMRAVITGARNERLMWWSDQIAAWLAERKASR
jgi:predicted DNA-binding transcriptional regulator AlpA